MTSLQVKGDDTLAILHQENVWICDMGTSTHVTWSNKCTRNVGDTKLYSLRHTGGAMESTAVIDIPGVFMTKCREKGLQAMLKDCSFNGGHNFNLLSMSKLLHTQEWKITHGDKSLIRIENDNGGVISFDIVVLTEKGTIYVCKFMRAAEVVTASTDCGIWLNINMAHYLLDHRNEGSGHKTGKELEWVIVQGMLKT